MRGNIPAVDGLNRCKWKSTLASDSFFYLNEWGLFTFPNSVPLHTHQAGKITSLCFRTTPASKLGAVRSLMLTTTRTSQDFDTHTETNNVLPYLSWSISLQDTYTCLHVATCLHLIVDMRSSPSLPHYKAGYRKPPLFVRNYPASRNKANRSR